MLSKKYEAKLEGFSEEEFRKLEELKDLFEFLDEIIPDDDVDEVLEARRGGGRKRCVARFFTYGVMVLIRAWTIQTV